MGLEGLKSESEVTKVKIWGHKVKTVETVGLKSELDFTKVNPVLRSQGTKWPSPNLADSCSSVVQGYQK